jgi:hypothetical protein
MDPMDSQVRTSGPLRIAVVYIAEAYQCYHAAAAALKLDEMPGVEVISFYFDPDTPRHVQRIHRAFGAKPMRMEPLRRSALTTVLQEAKVLGKFKHLALRDNRAVLDKFDAILAVENTVAIARAEGILKPRLIYTPHGFGDRAYSFVPRIAMFDFVLVAGQKTEQDMLDRNLIRAGSYALTGSIKLETAALLRKADGPLFSNNRPIVLYNPHFEAKLNSWKRFLKPMLEQFSARRDLNLIVAPHVKMFRNASLRARSKIVGQSTQSILIDLGSDRLLDSTYIERSSVYVGDVSSQVYEFLANPRPCVFLNAHGVNWREDPHYVHWTLGDVIDDPTRLHEAIAMAPERHHHYRETQAAVALAALGTNSRSTSDRAAEAIFAFLREERAKATSMIT